MKKLFLILCFGIIAFASEAQLSESEKKDTMRPKGMIQVGTTGLYDKKENDANTGLLITRYLLNNKIVGYRFLIIGSHTIFYYWIPKYCNCTQETRKIYE